MVRNHRFAHRRAFNLSRIPRGGYKRRKGIEMLRRAGYSSSLRGNNYTARVRIKYSPCAAPFAMHLTQAISSPNDYRRDRRAYCNCARLFYPPPSSSCKIYPELLRGGSFAEGSIRGIHPETRLVSSRTRIKPICRPARRMANVRAYDFDRLSMPWFRLVAQLT